MDNPKKKAFRHAESPDWPVIADILIEELKNAEKLYAIKMDTDILKS